jgi:hypothetical protein
MMLTRDDVLATLNDVVDAKNIGALEVQTPYRAVFRSPESGHATSLTGHTMFKLGLGFPAWKRNEDLIGEFEYEPFKRLSKSGRDLLREVQEMERSGLRWRVVVDRLNMKYASGS